MTLSFLSSTPGCGPDLGLPEPLCNVKLVPFPHPGNGLPCGAPPLASVPCRCQKARSGFPWEWGGYLSSGSAELQLPPSNCFPVQSGLVSFRCYSSCKSRRVSSPPSMQRWGGGQCRSRPGCSRVVEVVSCQPARVGGRREYRTGGDVAGQPRGSCPVRGLFEGLKSVVLVSRQRPALWWNEILRIRKCRTVRRTE